jgi:hypothetical protein
VDEQAARAQQQKIGAYLEKWRERVKKNSLPFPKLPKGRAHMAVTDL